MKEGPPQQESSKSPGQAAQEHGEEQESLRQAKDDAAQLRVMVERLESELNSVKARTEVGGGGGGMAAVGDAGFGLLGGGGSGVRFGAAAAPAAGSPWMAGGMAGEMGRGLVSLLGG